MAQEKIMHDDSVRDRLAADLLRARDTAQLATPPSQPGAAFDLDIAYQVGRVLHERLVARGFQSVGRKIGFTNPAVWEQFKVSQPIWAHMYAQSVHVAQGGSIRLSLDGMVAPRLEPEIVLKLRRPIPSGDPSPEELAGCVEWAAIGFEIVESHYPEWRFTAAEAVADFGVHAARVVGTPWQLGSADPQEVTAMLRTLKVSFRHGSEIFAEGEGCMRRKSPDCASGCRSCSTCCWPTPTPTRVRISGRSGDCSRRRPPILRF